MPRKDIPEPVPKTQKDVAISHGFKEIAENRGNYVQVYFDYLAMLAHFPCHKIKSKSPLHSNRVELAVLLSFLEWWAERNCVHRTQPFYCAPSELVNRFAWSEVKQQRLMRVLKSIGVLDVWIVWGRPDRSYKKKFPTRWMRIRYDKMAEVMRLSQANETEQGLKKAARELKAQRKNKRS